MKRVAGVTVALFCALVLFGARSGQSDDLGLQAANSLVAQADDAPSASKDAKTTQAKPKRRLPNGYGKLGLSSDQRQKIYAIQDSYSAEIEALERQLAELKARRDEEIVAVLTPEQKQALDAQVKEREAKKQATAAANKAKAAAPAP